MLASVASMLRSSIRAGLGVKSTWENRSATATPSSAASSRPAPLAGLSAVTTIPAAMPAWMIGRLSV